jgi:hypothetical protein
MLVTQFDDTKKILEMLIHLRSKKANPTNFDDSSNWLLNYLFPVEMNCRIRSEHS